MAIFKTDLSDFLIPKISDYEPDFGTMKQSGGLTTKEVSENIMYPLLAQRGFNVTETSSTTDIKRNSKFIVLEPSITLTLGDGTDGVTVDVYNRSGGNVNIVVNSVTLTLYDGEHLQYDWVLDQWENKTLTRAYVEDIVSLEYIENKAIPIGFIYVQYPNMKAPYEVWETITVEKWANISSEYADSFFRVAGDKAQDFENQETPQKEQVPNAKGWGSISTADWYGYMGGVKETPIANNSSVQWVGSGGNNMCYNFEFNSSNGQTNADGTYKVQAESSYVDGGEVRPKNWTIKIWKRIG